jgi:hypothetical protein
MVAKKTAALNLRIDPDIKNAASDLAKKHYRSVANMVEVLIIEQCGRDGISIPEQQALFDEPADKWKTIRALVEAGAVKKVLLIADGAVVHVDIVTQNGPIKATTNKGAIKTRRQRGLTHVLHRPVELTVVTGSWLAEFRKLGVKSLIYDS